MSNKKNKQSKLIGTLNDNRVKLLIQLLEIKEDMNMTRVYSALQPALFSDNNIITKF